MSSETKGFLLRCPGCTMNWPVSMGDAELVTAIRQHQAGTDHLDHIRPAGGLEMLVKVVREAAAVEVAEPS